MVEGSELRKVLSSRVLFFCNRDVFFLQGNPLGSRQAPSFVSRERSSLETYGVPDFASMDLSMFSPSLACLVCFTFFPHFPEKIKK